MPTRPCPECQQPAPRHLPHSSRDATTNYYRCGGCGFVFTVDKDQPDGPHRDVTTRNHDQGEGGGSSVTS
jgi:hypothetical protein